MDTSARATTESAPPTVAPPPDGGVRITAVGLTVQHDVSTALDDVTLGEQR